MVACSPSVRLVDVPFWLLRSFTLAYGLVVGSFLNVVIYRVPEGLSIVRPASRCGACGTPIAARDNIPVLGWILLRGKARCCGAKIALRYPMVELIGGLLAWACLEVVVLSAPLDTPLLPLLARGYADLAIVFALVAAAFIDLDHMYLPDEITLGGAVFALGTVGLRPELTWKVSLVGACVGYFGVMVPFVWLYKLIRGRPGMGEGDAKLLLLVGAWFGWRGVLFALFAGSLQGTLAAIVTLARHGKLEEPESVQQEREEAAAAGEAMDPDDPLAEPPPSGIGGQRLAFGPFLILGALEYLLFGRIVIERWLRGLLE